jgi:hypothetical protein
MGNRKVCPYNDGNKSKLQKYNNLLLKRAGNLDRPFLYSNNKKELRSPEPGNHELFSKVGTSADVLGFLSVTEACSPHLTPAP